MKLLDNYNKAVKELQEYFGKEIYNIEDYTDYYWNASNDTIYFSKDKLEVEELDDENLYEEDYKDILRKTELTAVLIESSFGDEDFWAIFDNKKEIL